MTGQVGQSVRLRYRPPAVAQRLNPGLPPPPGHLRCVPAPARPLLLAARHLALLNDSKPTDPLLREDYYARRVITPAAIQAVVAACAVPLPRLHPLGSAWTAYARCFWRWPLDAADGQGPPARSGPAGRRPRDRI
jgi:hypothetical protein